AMRPCCRHGNSFRVTEPSRAARPLALRPRLAAGLPLSRDPFVSGCPFAIRIGRGSRSSEPEFAWMDGCSAPLGRAPAAVRVASVGAVAGAHRRRPKAPSATAGAEYQVPTTKRLIGPKL